MKKNFKKLYSFILCLAIITVSITALPANAIAATTVSFSDKIIFENDVLGETSTYGLNNTGTEQEEPESLSVTLRFEESFSCDCGEITSDEELSFHRAELKEYYKALNERRIEALELEDNSDISYSHYGPFIEYVYEDYNSFTADDYDTLARKNPSDMTHVYIGNNYREEESATIGTGTRPDYNFADALADVGIPTNKTKHGEGIRIGVLEPKVPDSYAHMEAGYYYEYVDPEKESESDLNNPNESMTRSSHPFFVSAVLGGNYGIADKATIYFASTNSYSFLDCINWFLDNDINIINKSAGVINGSYTAKAALVDYIVRTTRITWVNSAGNQRNKTQNTYMFFDTSTSTNAICVASNDADKKISCFSSYLMSDIWEHRNCFLKPTITAPGGSIYNIANSDTTKSGTSYSAPFVTGIIALLMEEFPELTYSPEIVLALITSTCTNVAGQTGVVDEDAGFGIINYQNARQAYANTDSFVSYGNLSIGDVIRTNTITVNPNSNVLVTAVMLFNATYDGYGSYSPSLHAPNYREVLLKVYDSSNNLVFTGTQVANFSHVTISNTSGVSKTYTIKLCSNETITDNDTSTHFGALCYAYK